MMAAVADWLSFWNKTRKQKEAVLHGEVVEQIYVPYGEGRVSVGDSIYCVGIEAGKLLLITRVEVAKLSADHDPDHRESVVIDGAKKNTTKADFKRKLPASTVKKLKYRRRDDSEHNVKFKAEGGGVEPGQFQGPASIRELSQGAVHLESLL
jgi:hypothetical protein